MKARYRNKNLLLAWDKSTGLFHIFTDYEPQPDGGYTCSNQYTTPNAREAYINFSSRVQARDLREHLEWAETEGYDPQTGERKPPDD